MSQAKVDKYKEEKRNRAKIIKREKQKRAAAIALSCVIGAVLVGWIGYSLYENYKPVVKNTYSVDMTALNEYLASVDPQTESVGEDASEEATEASSEGATEAASEQISETEAVSETETE